MYQLGERLQQPASSSALLLAAAADGGVGLWWIDRSGAFHADGTLAAIWDRSPEELSRTELGAPLCFVHADDRERARAVLGHAALDGSERAFRVIRPDGSLRWVMCRRNAPRSGLRDGLAAGIALDWTAMQREHEMRLRTVAFEAVASLAARLAHGFNNLLFAILGNATLTLGAAPLPGDHAIRESLREIERAASRASDIVQRLSSYAHPAQPRRQLSKLGLLVDVTSRTLRSDLPPGLELQAALPAEEPSVLVDRRMIRELISNLVSNAAQAMEGRAGVIEVEVDRVSLGDEPFFPELKLDRGRFVALRVRDHGVGMDAATVEHCTDPFFSTRPRGASLGLGLCLARTIADAHGGALRIETEPELGTTVVVYFPER